MSRALLVLLLGLSGLLQAQYTIQTVWQEKYPDGLSATNTPIGVVEAVAADRNGNYYIASSTFNRIFMVDTSGKLSVFAGDGTTTTVDGAQATRTGLSNMTSVAVDKNGTVYIATTCRILSIASGIVHYFAGSACGNSSFSASPSSAVINPSKIAVDQAGVVYFIDHDANRVYKIQSGSLIAVAGNGQTGSSGDGGPALSAQLNIPGPLTVDAAGNLYIGSIVGGSIRRVDTGGTISTVTGSSSLISVSALATDSAGTLYISDNARVSTLTNGALTTFASSTATSLAFLADGSLLMGDRFTYRVRKFKSGSTDIVAGTGQLSAIGPPPLDQLGRPYSMVRAANGDLYFTDPDANAVRKVSGGVLSTVAGTGVFEYSGDNGPATSAALAYPRGLALDSNGSLYIADTGNCRIRKITVGNITTVAGNGSCGFSGDNGPPLSASLYYPTAVAIDASGNLFIADGNFRIRTIQSGAIYTIAGNGQPGFAGDNVPAINGGLSSPVAMAAVSSFWVYFSDNSLTRVRRVFSGSISTMAGGYFIGIDTPESGPATSVRIDPNAGLLVDPNGDLIFTESNKVRRVSGGQISTIAGSSTAGFSGDGGPALNATLSSPQGLAMDSSGNIYVADSGNRRIRVMLSSSGQSAALAVTAPMPMSEQLTTQPVNVTSNAAVAFTASSNTSWLTVSPSTGTTPATLTLTANVAGLSGGSYTGSFTLTPTSGSPLTNSVSLSVCTFDMSPATASIPGVGGYFTATVTSTCSWTPTTTASFVHIASFASGTLGYTVDSNATGASRTATISFGGHLFSITQQAQTRTANLFVPVSPCRVIDTRNATQPVADSTTTVTVAGTCGIPGSAQAYALNVTVVPKNILSYLTLWPAGAARPLVSTLNSPDGRVKANAAIVPAGTGGAVNVYVTDAADFVLDITGYFTTSGMAFYPLTPCRITDTRDSTAIDAGQTRVVPVRNVCGVPASAQAFSLNLTAVPAVPLAFLTAWPNGSPRPLASNLNAPTKAITANAALIPSGSDGSISIFAFNKTDVVVDINGYFASPGIGGLSYYSSVPCRAYDTRQQTIVGAGSTRPFDLSASPCGQLAGASAVALNVTAVPESVLGYLTLWPANSARPLASTLNAPDGSITSNMAIVPITAAGIQAFVTNNTNLILDISGYFAP